MKSLNYTKKYGSLTSEIYRKCLISKLGTNLILQNDDLTSDPSKISQIEDKNRFVSNLMINSTEMDKDLCLPTSLYPLLPTFGGPMVGGGPVVSLAHKNTINNFQNIEQKGLYISLEDKNIEISKSLPKKRLNDLNNISSYKNNNYVMKANALKFSKYKNLLKYRSTISRQELIFSTLERIHLKKNINLLFPIQEFVAINNQLTRQRTKEYSEILLCMKKLKIFYGFIPLNQLQKILSQALRAPGYFSKNFFSLIERRLDVVLYRSGYYKTIVAARQACLHSKIFVNSRRSRVPSRLLSPGDIITFHKNEHLISPNYPMQSENSSLFINNLPNVGKDKDGVSKKSEVISPSFLEYSVISYKTINLLSLYCLKQFEVNSNSNKNSDIKIYLKLQNSSGFSRKLIILNKLTHPEWVKSETTFSKFSGSDFFKYSSKFPDLTFTNSLNSVQKTNNSKIDLNLLKTISHMPSILNIQYAQSFAPQRNANIIEKKSVLVKNLVLLSKQLENYSSVFSLSFQKYLFEAFFNDSTLGQNDDSVKINKKVLKPTHLEISFITNSIIFLYSPQKIVLPFNIDIDILRKYLYQ